MIKALVIGLGNIGAQYDFNSEEVLTHVKALSLRSDVALSVFDINSELRNSVVKEYKCSFFTSYNEIDFTSFDIVSICTPTKFHFQMLQDCLKVNVPVILCEKPIAAEISEFEELRLSYKKSTSKVLVNYFRRFHTNYKELKHFIKEENENVAGVVVTYYKGWMNYASHALDIIQFLLEKEIDFNIITETNRFVDFLPNDPSISLNIKGKINLDCVAIKSINPLWEVDFYFENLRIKLLNGGQRIQLFKKNNLVWTKEHQLKDYMINVLNEAIDFIEHKTKKDNFMESLELNRKMLLII